MYVTLWKKKQLALVKIKLSNNVIFDKAFINVHASVEAFVVYILTTEYSKRRCIKHM